MKCPHCTTDFHEQWINAPFVRANGYAIKIPFRGVEAYWHYRTTVCSKCKDVTIEIAPTDGNGFLQEWRMVYPTRVSRGQISPEVPAGSAEDYREARDVLPISPKASAALSRR